MKPFYRPKKGCSWFPDFLLVGKVVVSKPTFAPSLSSDIGDDDGYDDQRRQNDHNHSSGSMHSNPTVWPISQKNGWDKKGGRRGLGNLLSSKS